MFFCSLNTFKIVMNIFVYVYNKFGEFKLRFPLLKNFAFLIDFLPYFFIWVLPKLYTS